ncbi:MAG: DUF86 domain-containing protein [Flavobacteriales bacterium]|nr:DUF86 domain-containing protein [Flavobacteriales bacterium]
MPRSLVLKYILDIESVIEEIEQVITLCDSNYETFTQNFMAIRTLERNLEIIGEAVSKMRKADPSISIQHSDSIISLRNYLAHAYDSIEISVIWSIAVKHVPALKQELRLLKG